MLTHLLIIIGCLLLAAAAVAAFVCGTALVERLQHERGILFMDVEVLALLTLLCAAPGGVMLLIARKLKRGRSDNSSQKAA